MKPKYLKLLTAVTALVFGAQAQADNLDPADFDVLYTLIGQGADTELPLSADLGIVVNGDGTATLTLHNTSDPDNGFGGNGVGDAPRIDELFFNLYGDTTGLTATILSITDGATSYDCDGADAAAGQCDWDLGGGGSSGGGGTFDLSYACGTSGQDSCDLGVPETLVFMLDMDADIDADTFLMAANSLANQGKGPNGPTYTDNSMCASFQSVGLDGEDSGVACGSGGGTTKVPEPGTLGLLSLGLIGAGMIRRRRVAAELS